jgi:glutamate formiminotransferase/formiminotetrahydrofolate cyclodeaminase
VKSMGLDELKPFRPEEKIIEYAIADRSKKHLVDLTLRRFVEETASESVAPGGGSVSASIGALGSALGTMVANISSHKRGWDERWEEFSDWAERGKRYHDELLLLVDEDTRAFNAVMSAFRLPSGTDEEKREREKAIEEATKRAIEIPFTVMELSLESMDVIGAMARIGNPNSVSDAGVGALCARSAVMGAHLNVRINAGDVKDRAWIDDLLERARVLEERTNAREREILDTVNEKLRGESD